MARNTAAIKRGWSYDSANTRLDVYVDGTKSAIFDNTGSYLTIPAGGLTITAGGLTVTAGGATITAGGLTVTAGGITVTASDVAMVAGTLDLQDGGSVSQATDRTTGVTLSTHSGKVTTQATSLAAVTTVTHTVTNTKVAATDTIILSKVSGDVDTMAYVSAVGAGSFDVTLRNEHASAADTTAFVYNFAVIKGATS